MPIIILYYLFYGLNYQQIGILASVLAISTILLEVPSGIFADKFGRKYSLLLCSVLGTISMLIYLFGSNFLMFLIATSLFGMSMAFFSGAEEALLYDSLVAEKIYKKYRKILGEVHFFSNIVSAVVLAIIPLIYLINVKYPFIIGTLFYIGSLFTALSMREAPLKTKEANPLYYFSELRHSKGLFLLILFGATTLALVYSTSEYYQPLLKIIGMSVSFFGLIYFAKRIFTGIGAKFAHKLEKHFKPYKILIILSLMIVLCYASIFFGYGWLIVAGILFYDLAEGVCKVSIKDDINKLTSSHNRATILSVLSFMQEIIIAILALFYGYFADIIGVQEVFGIGLALSAIILGNILWMIKSRKILEV